MHRLSDPLARDAVDARYSNIAPPQYYSAAYRHGPHVPDSRPGLKQRATLNPHYTGDEQLSRMSTFSIDVKAGVGAAGVAYGLGLSNMITIIAGAAGLLYPMVISGAPSSVDDVLLGAGILGAGARVGGMSMNTRYIALAGGAAAGYFVGNKSS